MSIVDLFIVESVIFKGQLLLKKNVVILYMCIVIGEYGGGVYNMSNGIWLYGFGYGYEFSVFFLLDGKIGVVLLSNYYCKVVGS